MSTTRTLAISAGIIGLIGALASIGVFAAFSASTSNAGNSIAAGTVVIADNDAGAAFYNVTNQKPGDTQQKCIKVTYTGSLDADVKIYTPDTIGAIGPYVNLTIEAGTQASPTFPSCTGFTPDAGGPLFSGTLAGFAAANNSYANGILDRPGTVATKWVNNDSVVYRITATLADNDLAQGTSSGTHSFKWEARNQ